MANDKSSPPRVLVIGGIILALLVFVAVLTSLVTRNISRSVEKGELSQKKVLPTPTPKERSIYLDLPESFPKDMPLITRSKVKVGKEDEDNWTAVLLTAVALEEANDFYIKELPKGGWSITNKSEAAGLTVFYVAKDNREAIIAIGKSEQGVAVSITILKNA